MAINIISVQYNGGHLSDIILLTQGYYTFGEPVQIPRCRGFVVTAYETVDCIVSVLFLLFVWCPCMLHGDLCKCTV